ncbi:hypothetical protein NEUTE1DRAFT_111092 [Neurospora tetrasperma FGSC 2508]|uniref:Uncharacterized protein n=1 Tax=Neurospora tetrasperma (strain FGSC 2508 / ATCC MYA-4615 / P0657) TaxID=510951 RepID=F8MQK0_NEUT8|nr:uncharacterized protein NEUTE1DRAFT_111092 [Neurospora tetrasperma FGSC 2508]EGO56630.1 hypothetical protein NEUTE1DRAFT_111092 [Neurospora tetrasperma FGSC 2508]EGZ70496.1 hypothetical protein NEUTE2DRAFT_139956 [Neurospora tetrasperma FGSC 2509]
MLVWCSDSVARKTPAQSFIGSCWRHSTTPRWRFDAVTLECLPDVIDEDREEEGLIRFVPGKVDNQEVDLFGGDPQKAWGARGEVGNTTMLASWPSAFHPPLIDNYCWGNASEESYILLLGLVYTDETIPTAVRVNVQVVGRHAVSNDLDCVVWTRPASTSGHAPVNVMKRLCSAFHAIRVENSGMCRKETLDMCIRSLFGWWSAAVACARLRGHCTNSQVTNP